MRFECLSLNALLRRVNQLLLRGDGDDYGEGCHGRSPIGKFFLCHIIIIMKEGDLITQNGSAGGRDALSDM